jgi:hypothetical protein
MSQISIVSVTPPSKNAQQVLGAECLTFEVAAQMPASHMDILRDGEYVTSIHRLGGKKAFWSLYQRSAETVFRLKTFQMARDFIKRSH